MIRQNCTLLWTRESQPADPHLTPSDDSSEVHAPVDEAKPIADPHLIVVHRSVHF
jgi:hypothetical protein